MPPPQLDDDDWRDITAFVEGRRIYSVCVAPIHDLVLGALSHADGEVPGRDVLVLKVLQGRPWGEVARLTGAPGRRGVLEALRAALRPLVDRWRGG